VSLLWGVPFFGDVVEAWVAIGLAQLLPQALPALSIPASRRDHCGRDTLHRPLAHRERRR
jgi:hypothetical protein